MKTKTASLLYLLLFTCKGLFAQTDSMTSEIFNPDILPHSPEAEAMAKYTACPVTLYSGLPDVSVPLYELKTKNLDVPISLGYNYNGFKPAEVASYVGLGWNLQGGGIITRMVKSRVDHEDPHVIGNDYDNYVNINLITVKQTVLQNTALGEMDGEPDLYVFNCNGLQGKFIWLQNQAYMFPYQNITITGYSGGFIITDAKGNRYIFTQQETTHHVEKRPGAIDYIPNYTSAWCLSQIISEDLEDTITYSYTPYTFNQPPVYSEVYTMTLPVGSSPAVGDPQTLTETSSTGDYVNSLCLSQISYKTTIINLALNSTPRKDVFLADGNMYALASVNIADAQSQQVLQYNLIHNYFNGKLSLTEVDEVNPSKLNVVQRYQFQYLDQDTSMGDVPGFFTRGIDTWGYYNGATNSMLFTSTDIANTTYLPANRTPNFSTEETNILSQVNYPTGGYTTFSYGINQTGSYIVPGTYTNESVSNVSQYMENSQTVNGGVEDTSNFSLGTAQTVQCIMQNLVPNSITYRSSVLRIYDQEYNLLYSSPLLPSGVYADTTTVSLPAGPLIYVVRCDNKGGESKATINYVIPVIDNTLGPAPGLHVSTISYYDNATQTSPSLTKQYNYTNGVGLFVGGTSSSSVIQYGDLCNVVQNNREILTLQAGLNAPISDLLNNQFYYQNVEEIDIGSGSNGKTEYVYNCYGASEPDVYLQQQTDSGYYNGSYIPLTQTVNTYQLTNKRGFVTYKSILTGQMYPPGGSVECPNIPTPDQTEPVVSVPNVYSAIRNSLMSAYKTLQSTVSTTWDMTGQNPVINTTNYYYDNPSHLFPTRIITHNSKGQQVTVQMKYPLDYSVPKCLTLYGLDSVFSNAINTSTLGYNLCYDSLVSALNPYQPYSFYESQFTTVNNSYNCENEFKASSATAFSERTTTISAYIASLDSAQTADTAWHRALYWMQANNDVGQVIEKYTSIVESDGNPYLVSAQRQDYSMVNTPANVLVAKPTSVDLVQLTSPLLMSTFTANIGAFYVKQDSTNYDAMTSLASQWELNNVHYGYLWGYNHRFLVAEVEGVNQSTIAGMVNQAVLDNPSSTQALMTELAKIRTGLAGTKALVTTCTYDPMVGITSKTDPAGRTTYYDYDGICRLVDIKNQDGYIVKTFQYHYQSQ